MSGPGSVSGAVWWTDGKHEDVKTGGCSTVTHRMIRKPNCSRFGNEEAYIRFPHTLSAQQNNSGATDGTSPRLLLAAEPRAAEASRSGRLQQNYKLTLKLLIM